MVSKMLVELNQVGSKEKKAVKGPGESFHWLLKKKHEDSYWVITYERTMVDYGEMCSAG